MKEYPSIPRQLVNKSIYAFDKLDGSNVRAEWSKKKGFYKFGKRHGLVDETDPLLGESKKLILNSYSEELTKIFRQQRVEKATCFFEFFGPSSFAGNHDPNEKHKVVLFDICLNNRGFLEPKAFLNLVDSKVETASLLYVGNPNSEFVESVNNGTLSGMTFEGVVCKGTYVSPGMPLMFKIKNLAWINKLKTKYQNDEKMIERLI